MREKPVATLRNEESDRITAAYERRSQSVVQGQYSLFEPSHLLRVQERERRALKVIEAQIGPNLENSRILEVGCGSGHWLRQLVEWGARPANLTGVDLIADRISEARERCPAGVKLETSEASHLGFADESFDIVLQSTVFSSILNPEMKTAVAEEMLRVVKREGFILWYDFFMNNPRNRDVRGIGKKELHRLFPGCRIQRERLTLAPPVGRVLARVSTFAYNLVSALRFACTHYLAVIEKGK